MQDFLPAEYGTAASALQAAFTVAEVTSAAAEHLGDGKGVGVGRTVFTLRNLFPYAWQFTVRGVRGLQKKDCSYY